MSSNPSGKRTMVLLGVGVLALLVAAYVWFFGRASTAPSSETQAAQDKSAAMESTVQTQQPPDLPVSQRAARGAVPVK